jgi:hypothetical protein
MVKRRVRGLTALLLIYIILSFIVFSREGSIFNAVEFFGVLIGVSVIFYLVIKFFVWLLDEYADE